EGAGQARVVQSSHRSAADLNAVAVNVNLAIRCAYNYRNWPFRRFFRRPSETACRRCDGLSGKEKARPVGVVRSGLIIRDNDGGTHTCDRVKFCREIDWHS